MYRPGADVIMARIMTGEATHDIIYEDWRTQYYAMAGHGMLDDLNEMLPEEYYNNLYETDRIISSGSPFRRRSHLHFWQYLRQLLDSDSHGLQ